MSEKKRAPFIVSAIILSVFIAIPFLLTLVSYIVGFVQDGWHLGQFLTHELSTILYAFLSEAVLAFFAGLVSVCMVYGFTRYPIKKLRYILLVLLGILFMPAVHWESALLAWIPQWVTGDAANMIIATVRVIVQYAFLPTLFGLFYIQRTAPTLKYAAYAVGLVAAPQLVLFAPSSWILSLFQEELFFIDSNAIIELVILLFKILFAVGAFFAMRYCFRKLYDAILRKTIFGDREKDKKSNLVMSVLTQDISALMILIAGFIMIAEIFWAASNGLLDHKSILYMVQNLILDRPIELLVILLSALLFFGSTLCFSYTLYIGKRRTQWVMLICMACMALGGDLVSSFMSIIWYYNNILDSCISPFYAFILCFWVRINAGNSCTSFKAYWKQAVLPLVCLTVINMFYFQEPWLYQNIYQMYLAVIVLIVLIPLFAALHVRSHKRVC